MAIERRRLRFKGRVQGVGFRHRAGYLAASLKLTGWVKNEYNGTVIMEVQGKEATIYRLMEGINRDIYIQIDWIDSKEIPVKEESCFSIK